MDVRVQSAKSIFLSLVEGFSPDQWPKALDECCGTDVTLRYEVERLLRGHRQELDLVKQGEAALREIIGSEDQPSFTVLPGTVIGPYKLLDQIGEGGFGVVFMAEQERPMKRRVALKVIKPGMDTRQVIARFEAERQALAMMDHPNIAKVHDAGATENSRPYFVMELVQGVPITEYCDRCNLTTRERLELFVTVCQAIQHAHQKGVIHRDIKPTNVLVAMQDGRPAPKIIDFGVAKAIGQRLTEHTLTTAFAQMVGSPLYMSPEQAELSPLGVDTRSDVYSLGVLLYELLCGTTPFDKDRLHRASYDEMRHIIREEEPPRPSTRISTLAADLATTVAQNRRTDAPHLSQQVRGELDWIVMKCLDKDRNRRYETANALAQDIERYLADEPVQACPPSTVYRLRKFARRNRMPVLAASFVLLALVIGVIGTTWGMLRATRAQTAAVNEANQKDAALEAAQQSERNARGQLFLALWNQARAGRFSRRLGQRVESLAALAKAAKIRPDERLRDEAIAAMALPDLRRVAVWRPAPSGTTAMTYSGLCRLYASIDAQWNMSLRQISDNHLVQSVAAGPLMPTNRFEFSPDEQFVIARTSPKKLTNSQWFNSGSLFVGDLGTGSLNITNHGTVRSVGGAVGAAAGASGTVTISDVGSDWLNSGDLNVGGVGSGTVDITAGGHLSTDNGFIGRDAGSIGELNVDGANSIWASQTNLTVGDAGMGVLNITNGGFVGSDKSILGRDPGSSGTANITGEDSQWDPEILHVGDSGHGIVNVTDGGFLDTVDAVIGLETGSVGEVTVDGAGSLWQNDNLILVSSFAPGTGTLTVSNGGAVSSAGGMIVRVLGTLRGDGQIIGDVSNVGIVAPGNSAGTLHIDGDFTQAVGKLQSEIGGTTPGSQFDMLDITGAATLGGTLEVSLIDGFTPSVGDVFEIVHADSGVFGGFDTFSLPTVPGRSWAFVNTSVSFFLLVGSAPVPGDFNDDGHVDAADYVVWRKTDGSPTGYNLWRSHFGQTAGGGVALSSADPRSAAVPEPATLILMILVAVGWCLDQRRVA
jgi:T5SS/PEP-CTERM-associated repeat protein